MAFEELSASLEFDQGQTTREAAEQWAYVEIARTAARGPRTPYVNRAGLPPKQPRQGKDRAPQPPSTGWTAPPPRMVAFRWL